MNDLINFDKFFRGPVSRQSVGFDDLFTRVFKDMSLAAQQSYPPYNVTGFTDADGNKVYEITMAVAGFTEKDIDIVLEGKYLKVSGKSEVLASSENVEYFHKGIAERSFVRTFVKSDDTEVSSADLKDGILRIQLKRKDVGEDQVKRIPINLQ